MEYKGIKVKSDGGNGVEMCEVPQLNATSDTLYLEALHPDGGEVPEDELAVPGHRGEGGGRRFVPGVVPHLVR